MSATWVRVMPTTRPLSVEELEAASREICGTVQYEAFKEDMDRVKQSKHVSKQSQLVRLSPILEGSLLCVGGRLCHANLDDATKHPILLPHKHHVTTLIVRHYHQVNGHVGAHQVLSLIRKRFWILRGLSAVKRVLGSCIPCRRRHARPCTQIEAPLPVERLTPDKPPFSFVGIDYFGPFSGQGKTISQQKIWLHIYVPSNPRNPPRNCTFAGHRFTYRSSAALH